MRRLGLRMNAPDPLLWEGVVKSAASHRVLNNGAGRSFVVPCDNHSLRLLCPILSFQQRVRVGIGARLSRASFVRPTPLTEQLITELPVLNAIAVGRIGSPGPYSKDLLLIFSDRVPVMCLKVGTSLRGVSLVRGEASVLELLRKNPKLQPYLPEIAFTRTVGQSYILAEQYAPGEIGGPELSAIHLDFLTALRSQPCGTVAAFLAHCQATVAEFWQELSASWKTRIERCLVLLGRLPQSLPTVFAHRDFTRWNVIHSQTGITVLDWEYAAESRVPMHDLYHYLLFRRALRRDLSPSVIRGTRALAVSVMEQSGGGAFAAAAPLQMLAYLLDVCILHLQSHHGRASSPAAERYAAMIEAFPSWSQ